MIRAPISDLQGDQVEEAIRGCNQFRDGNATMATVECDGGCIRMSGLDGGNAKGRCGFGGGGTECTFLEMNTENDVVHCGECTTDFCNAAAGLHAGASAAAALAAAIAAASWSWPGGMGA